MAAEEGARILFSDCFPSCITLDVLLVVPGQVFLFLLGLCQRKTTLVEYLLCVSTALRCCPDLSALQQHSEASDY